MTKFYYPQIPTDLTYPLQFREPGKPFEGTVQNPWEVLALFEPVDVLNGAIEVVDHNGATLSFFTEDQTMIEKNDYGSKEAIYVKVN